MDSLQFIQDYMLKMKEVQENLLSYFENDTSQDDEFQKLITTIKNKNIQNDKHNFRTFLHLISSLCFTHEIKHEKIDKILSHYKKEIKGFFSNFGIFNIFKYNKRILFFLFKEQILIPDILICNVIKNDNFAYKRSYQKYFYPEFKSIYNKDYHKKLLSKYPELSEINYEEFDVKRKNGLDDTEPYSYIHNIDNEIRYHNFSKLCEIINESSLTSDDQYYKFALFCEYDYFYIADFILRNMILNECNLECILILKIFHIILF